MLKALVNIKTFVFFLLVSAFMNTYGQAWQGYESISTAQGLSQGMVFDLLQDKEGFLWVATKDGLNRYDGYNFKIFTNDPYNSKSLSSNNINKLFEDSKGQIWVGTENEGLNIYDKKNGEFYRIIHNSTSVNGLSNNAIKLIEELPDGRMLVATDDGIINVITLKNNSDNNVHTIIKTALPNKAKIYGIGNDKNGNTWIGGMDGAVYKFNKIKCNFILLPNGQLLNNGYFTKDENILINSNLYLYNGKEIMPLFDATKVKEGNIIFKPNSALWDKHHRETSFYEVSTWAPNKKIQWGLKLPVDKRIIYPFIFDRAGMLFTGTVGYGLRKYNIDYDKFNAQLNAYSIYAIVPNSANDIFLGDNSYRWKRVQNNIIEENAFSKIPKEIQLDNFIIAKSGDYWLKSDNKGCFKYNPKTNKLTPYPSIIDFKGFGFKQPIIEDSKNQIWFAGLGGTFMLLNTTTEKITTVNINSNTAAKPLAKTAICTALYEDKNGVYWIGTIDGLARVILDSTKNLEAQINWYYNNSTKNSLNYNHVSCFMDDPANANYLWIGTKGGGLNRLEKSTGNFSHITVKNGLPDNVIYGLLTDDAGNIWGSTNKGIFCMSASKNNETNKWLFRNFTKEDGLQDNEFNTNAYSKLPNGYLAFGGVNGLNIFDPKEVLVNNYTPNIFITNILVNNLQVLPNDKSGVLKNTIEQTETISLTYLQDILTLEFASLDYTTTSQNKYRYKLDGADKDWVEVGTRRNATYLHLPAGKYIFKVQGSNSHGIWSENIASLKINVLPPWWRTWGAYLFYLLIIGFCIRAYLKFKVNKAKLQNQLNYEQQEAKRVKELDAVKTQLYTNITHEFRTPLTVILGMAQQVKDKPDKYFEKGMNMIVRNGENLLFLVNEMLDLSKLENGKMELHLIQGDVINFLRYIVESFQSLAETQHKQLHYLSSLDCLYTFYDAEKLRQIISNLLSNALKFTTENDNIYISISEKISTDQPNTTLLIIKLKDTGIGIPEEEQQHIFDRFYQLGSSLSPKTEGTGIGLALTKELVKLMNGEIIVKSQPTATNIGTEFTVILPYPINVEITNYFENSFMNNENAPTITQTKENEIDISAKNNDIEKQLILLVEDNVDVVTYTASCLPEYRLAVCKNGKEGIELATELIPDLIITDVMMPYVNGFEMCQKLRCDERTSHIPIIMLTAKADIESKMQGLQLGADAYLEKPFNQEELLIRIKKLLELRKNLQQYYSKQVAHNNYTEKISEQLLPHLPIEIIENEFVKKVRVAVETHMEDERFSVEQLCKYIFMSHSQLHRKLDALIGFSPNKFIRLIRLNKAKELLQINEKSIAAVSLDCGYNDPGYFTRVFKQEFGVTPQEWRVNKEKNAIKIIN